jgi:hypothetical protein
LRAASESGFAVFNQPRPPFISGAGDRGCACVTNGTLREVFPKKDWAQVFLDETPVPDRTIATASNMAVIDMDPTVAHSYS